MLRGLTEDYEWIEEKTYIDRDFGMDSIRTMMRNIFIDKLSTSDNSNAVRGRGVGRRIAMQASGDKGDLSHIMCFRCNEFGHRMKQCLLPASNQEAKHGKSKEKMPYYKSKPQSNSDCRSQKERHEETSGTAHATVMQTVYNSYGSTTEEPATSKHQQKDEKSYISYSAKEEPLATTRTTAKPAVFLGMPVSDRFNGLQKEQLGVFGAFGEIALVATQTVNNNEVRSTTSSGAAVVSTVTGLDTSG